MKLNKIIRKSPKGVTLIELSVVIAVILVLISVLFIGATYYKDSADNAACVIVQSSIQKAADSYNNISGGSAGAAGAGIVGAGKPFPTALPACPTGGVFSLTFATGGEVATVVCNDSHS